MVRERRNLGMKWVVVYALGVIACGDETIPLPDATPFETRGLRLLMSAAELRVVRPGVYTGPQGHLREYFLSSWITYGFHPTAAGTGPPPSARLEYVEYTEELRDSMSLGKRWSESLAALEAELGFSPTCRARILGSTSLRLAIFDTLPRVILSSRVTRSPDSAAEGITFTAALVAAERSYETHAEAEGLHWDRCDGVRPRPTDDLPNPR